MRLASPTLYWLIINWCFRNRKCFTCQFRSQYRRTRRDVFPALSRIQNIGYDLGENGRTPEWYRANHRTPWVASAALPSTFRLPVRHDSCWSAVMVAVLAGRWVPARQRSAMI